MTHHVDAATPTGRRGRLAPTTFKRLSRPGTAVAVLAVIGLTLAACGSSTPTAATTTSPPSTGTGTGTGSSTTAASATATVKSASTNKGTVLENSSGMPLYTLAAGTSCTGACAQAWPPLTVPAGTTPKAGPGVTGTLATTMSGGALEVTYNGKALYTFLSDSAGQVTGDGVAGFSVAKVAAASGSGVPANNTPGTTKAPATTKATTTTAGGGYHY
jgi:predicted lipoprotein with Yx(FWY)xxD motif